MKTGRLLKFQRPGGELHAYLFRDDTAHSGVVYLFSNTRESDARPLQSFSAASETEVEAAVRNWLDEHYPRQ